jgi:predicted ATPase
MKILSLEVHDFRSLKDVTWQPGDLNLVIGPNASGKSNLLQALELLRSCAEEGALSDHVIRAGGMHPLVWDGTAEGFSFRLRASIAPTSEEPAHSLEYLIRPRRIGNTSAFRIGAEELNDSTPAPGGGTGPLAFRRAGPEWWLFDGNNSPQSAGIMGDDETLLSTVRGVFGPSDLWNSFGDQLARWSIYQDFRTDRDSPVRRPNLTRYETDVSPDGSNLVSVLHTRYSSNREFQESVDAAMRVAFGDDYDRLTFPPAADGRVQLRLRWKSLKQEQSADQLSDGTLRFLFLITVLDHESPPPLIAIDEPETGLHPRMMPLIAEHARDAADRSQVILTTHSAEFLDAFSEFQPTVTVADREEGATNLRVVDGKELDHWLSAYTLGQIYRSRTLEQMDPAA